MNSTLVRCVYIHSRCLLSLSHPPLILYRSLIIFVKHDGLGNLVACTRHFIAAGININVLRIQFAMWHFSNLKYCQLYLNYVAATM
jgi:hypothetical protein